jgi:hypothetical protein
VYRRNVILREQSERRIQQMLPEARLVQISSTHILSEVIDLNDAASVTNASFLTTDVILNEP